MSERPPQLTRRHFLQAIVVTAGTAQACSSDPDVPPPPIVATYEDGEKYFPQSIASGDPKPTSVILWTRVEDAESVSSLYVALEVATDEKFTSPVVQMANLMAAADHDNVIKVKVAELMPRTTYYYRFIYEKTDKGYSSKVGRTRTAPAADDLAIVKFAVATCQDFRGRYYNAWQRLSQLDADLDFVIFLGDYIYETVTGPTATRSVQFSDPASALLLPGGNAAAQSVSNYRDLYKTYRSDKFLKAVHERYPFVFVWDDHEYSDDCWGENSTYTGGIADGPMGDRRRNAEQAYFEHVPLDLDEVPGLVVGVAPLYPHTRIYRDLGFGKNLRLLVADCRTYRPDHLIPEGAYPGTVVMPQDVLAAAQLDGVFTSDTFAYVDIDSKEYSGEKLLLQLAYQQLATTAGVDPADAQTRSQKFVAGNLSLAYVNAVLTDRAIGAAPIPADGKPRGLAFVHMGKRDLFGIQGSRYVVVKDTFDVYAAYQSKITGGSAEDVLGEMQQTWIDRALAKPETWKVLVSSVSLTSMQLDLRAKMDVEDATLRNRYYLNVDQWDGFPDAKKEILGKLAMNGGKAFAVSGDIHGSFASVEGGVACLTTPAISSQGIKDGASEIALASGFTKTSAIYRYVVTDLDTTFREANPSIALSDSESHGFLVVEVGSEEALATFHLLPSSRVTVDFSTRPNDLPAEFKETKLTVLPGAIKPA